MNDKGRGVWQIAAGELGRDYSDLFLKYDVMFQGPAQYGKYVREKYQAVAERGERSSMKMGMIRHFYEDMKIGDVVLMRFRNKAEAIGVVASDAKYDERFDDIYGWNTQHRRRVIWQNQLKRKLDKIQEETGNFFSSRFGTFSRVHKGYTLKAIQPLIENFEERELNDLPNPPQEPLTLEKLGKLLFYEGLPNDSIDKVIKTIQRQRRLSKWYDTQNKEAKRPKEHEVVAHMVLPLLLGLGWSEQLLAIEWKHIDLAGFRSTPTTDENCILVCEAKGRWHSVIKNYGQAKDYAIKLNNCNKILLTDGSLYFLYQKQRDETWSDEPKPIGYLNINNIRTNYLAPADTNAISTLMALTPMNIEREVKQNSE